jgi:hypothetical protein
MSGAECPLLENSGKHLLVASFSPFDPNAKCRTAARMPDFDSKPEATGRLSKWRL